MHTACARQSACSKHGPADESKSLCSRRTSNLPSMCTARAGTGPRTSRKITLFTIGLGVSTLLQGQGLSFMLVLIFALRGLPFSSAFVCRKVSRLLGP